MRLRRASALVLLQLLLAVCPTCAEPPEPRTPALEIPDPFPGQVWTRQVEPGWTVAPGETWAVQYDLDLDLSRHEDRYGRFTHVLVAVSGELRHDADGMYRAGATSWAVSSNFTTTGMPVERHDGWPRLRQLHGKGGSPFEAVEEFPLPDGSAMRAAHSFQGALSVQVPHDIPEGWYEPRIFVFVRVAGVDDPVHLAQFRENWAESPPQVLPLVQVGDPTMPHLPWTLLGRTQYRGQPGVLPLELQGRVAICARSGFPATTVIPPGSYAISPALPTLFPKESLAPVDGGLEVVPETMPHHVRLDSAAVQCRVARPDGRIEDLGSRQAVGDGWVELDLDGGPFLVDMQATGHYVLHVTGTVEDALGRRFTAGGSYDVWTALPLSISTSCKPGNSFLVGDAYPAKVNVNPPVPADVRVAVEYYPDSDPARVRHWVAEGQASRFGHFVPYDLAPIVFDEPGEYLSRVTVRYTDAMGRLWMMEQTSAGVVAPQEREMVLHGTRSFPYDIQLFEERWGAVERFEDRQDLTTSFLSYTPAPLPDPYAPYDPQDTLLIASNGFNESLVEPHLTMSLSDPALAARLQEAYRHDSVLVPASIQPPDDRWHYLDDVVQISTDSAAWFPASAEYLDELPILPARSDGLHPFAFPEGNDVDAYTYLGVIRPGFPAMTSVFQSDAIGLYWMASPNRFGHHFNAGPNGDLPGDLYRIQAGAVLKDHAGGRNYYDAYSAAVVVTPSEGTATSIVAPGERALLERNGQSHFVFVTQDTHDTLEVGERMGFGGLVFPGIEADVTWTVTKPGGEVVEVAGRSNRLGIVRGRPAIPVDEPGLYRARVQMRYGDLVGDLPGTYDGTFWHCAVAPGAPVLLRTELPGMTEVDPQAGVRIPLSWPAGMTDVRLNFAVLMPGMVLDQGEVRPSAAAWEYPYVPAQMAVQHPNLDVRDFATGEWSMADTLIFQFLLEGELDGERVVDSLRLILRDDRLFNHRELMAPRGSSSKMPHAHPQ